MYSQKKSPSKLNNYFQCKTFNHTLISFNDVGYQSRVNTLSSPNPDITSKHPGTKGPSSKGDNNINWVLVFKCKYMVSYVFILIERYL